MTARAPRSERVAGDMRDRILGSARQCLLRFGTRKTTMDDVAREAGCSRATLYLHFASKPDLYATLLEAEVDAFVAEAETRLAGKDTPYERFLALGRLWVATYKVNPILHLALSHDTEMTRDPTGREAVRRQQHRIIALVARVLGEGVERGQIREVDTERVAFLMVHMMRLLIERELAGFGDYPYQEMRDLAGEVFFLGILDPKLRRKAGSQCPQVP